MKKYGDQHQGFTIEVTPQWIESWLERPGDICFCSRDGAAVTIRSCIATPSSISDPIRRTEKIYEELDAEMPGARQNWDTFRAIPGDINIASGQVIGREGAVGLISILNRGIEYTIRYIIPITSPFSAVKNVNDLVLSFRLRSQPDIELFIDPQKFLKGRKRWWHFWRWLGQ